MNNLDFLVTSIDRLGLETSQPQQQQQQRLNIISTQTTIMGNKVIQNVVSGSSSPSRMSTLSKHQQQMENSTSRGTVSGSTELLSRRRSQEVNLADFDVAHDLVSTDSASSSGTTSSSSSSSGSSLSTSPSKSSASNVPSDSSSSSSTTSSVAQIVPISGESQAPTRSSASTLGSVSLSYEPSSSSMVVFDFNSVNSETNSKDFKF